VKAEKIEGREKGEGKGDCREKMVDGGK